MVCVIGLGRGGVEDASGEPLPHGEAAAAADVHSASASARFLGGHDGVHNGVDAWRKLCRDQLPLADDKRNILMTESMKFQELATPGGLRHIVSEIERITDNWERVASRPFDEEANVGKIRELIPTSIWSYIAQSARATNTYSNRGSGSQINPSINNTTNARTRSAMIKMAFRE